MKALNARSGKSIADTVVKANSALSRMKGLLGRADFPPGEALLLKPCKLIHTFGMKFPIDVLFLGKGNDVVAVEENLLPNRLSAFVIRASSVLELPAGTLAATDTKKGDKIELS
ncbi:MAG: DUF192 domain-containing protein [Nitrospirota bacterium]|jgi:uncharacterized membrane protein (UPF0127 family)